ncbi:MULTISPECIES: sugar-binding transcriptional regulator [Bacillus]|uniref:sugar-binding transcriptional regulator n=1 Tax=Bacillus TaxID=1386 RepID=UPI00031C4A1D|nr:MULTISPECIES: sugar-binding transcriptional regulator [Bacillus]
MESEKFKKVIEAAKLYYLMDCSQQEIANRLSISRPTVSRLLQQAKEEGIVEIRINDPSEDCKQYEKELEKKFGLKKAVVAYAPVYEENDIKTIIGKKAAAYLSKMVKDGDVIGTVWGTTIYQVSTYLEHKALKDVSIVQLKGGISHSEKKTFASETLHLFEKAFNAKSFQLPIPAIVDHVVVKQAIEADRHIGKLLNMGKQANIAIFTVGVPRTDSLLFQLGYLTEEEEKTISKHAVGDISSRFFDKDGNICEPLLNARTIGIELEELKKKEQSILVAGGMKKVDGILGALKAKYANILITDSCTAKILLNNE